MTSIIDELYYNAISECDILKESAEYDKITKEASCYYEKLCSTVNEEQKEIIDKLLNADVATEAEASRLMYSEGFKTGAKLIMEILGLFPVSR